MARRKTYRYIFWLLISLGINLPIAAQKNEKVSSAEKAPLLGGVAIGADLCGLSMKAIGAKFANIEVMGRFNLREKYFPTVELGIGDCTREGGENTNRFSTTAPYFRIGMDYNFNKKVNGNRFFGIARYGFSNYNYDFSSPAYTDPVYHTEKSGLELNGLKGKAQWIELGVGLETKVWSIVRLGWSFRFKSRLKQQASVFGAPYFIPGFGRNDGTCWGGTVNLIFDVGKSARKQAGTTISNSTGNNTKESQANKKNPTQ